MNRKTLIAAVQDRTGLTTQAATAAVNAIMAVIQNTVIDGDRVSLTGFGVFESRERAGRMARNPSTGESLEIKPSRVPMFRPGKEFKLAVKTTPPRPGL